MQNSIKATAATAIVSFLLSNNALAQDTHTSTAAKTVYTNIPTIEKNISANISKEDIAANNPIVVAKFSTLFPVATNQQWASTNNNLWVSFLNNGRKASASFTPKGKVNYVILDCAMEQLPAAFCKTIKKDYPLYNLYNAIEITANDAVTYQVVLENPVNFITLKYTSEGVEETKQVKKIID